MDIGSRIWNLSVQNYWCTHYFLTLDEAWELYEEDFKQLGITFTEFLTRPVYGLYLYIIQEYKTHERNL